MSFTVPCPHCSAPIRIRDEFAGRAMKCPQCQGVVPKSATARPDDDEDDAPAPVKPKTKPAAVRPRPADDEDDRPRSRRRADDEDDEEDDRPRRRSRRDDEDDRPRKKKSALPLVLGILGGVFLLCGGGCAGVYFFGIKPAADRVKAKNDELAREIEEAMKKDLEAMAKGGPANTTPATTPALPTTGTPVATLTPDELSQTAAKYNGQWVVVKGKVQFGMDKALDWGVVEMVKKGGLALKFNPPRGQFPKSVLLASGDEVEILCLVGKPSEYGYVDLNNAQVQKRVAGNTAANTPKPLTPNTPPTAARPAPAPVRPTPADEKPIEITAVDLLAEYAKDQKAADAKYKEKVLKVTGEVKRAAPGAVNLVGKPEGGWTLQVTAPVPREDRVAVGNLKAGDTVTLTGKVALFTTNNTTKAATLLLRDGKLVK